MENISHSVLSPIPTVTTVPIINPTGSTDFGNYEHLMRRSTPTPLQLKHRAKRAGSKASPGANPPPPPPGAYAQSHEFKTASLLCKKEGYSLSSHNKLNGTEGSLYDYFCLSGAIAKQDALVTASEALELCSEIGDELTRLKFTTGEEDVKKYKAYCTNLLSNIVVKGDENEVDNLRTFLNAQSELNGIDLERVKVLLNTKKNKAQAANIVKHHSSVVYSVSSRLFGRFNSVLVFCTLSLYTAYIRNYS